MNSGAPACSSRPGYVCRGKSVALLGHSDWWVPLLDGPVQKIRAGAVASAHYPSKPARALSCTTAGAAT
jgi:hypothetical protein